VLDLEFKITAKLWIYDGPSPWYFITIPKKEASYIRKEFRDIHGGWGSLPVEVKIGKTSWKTSIFWEKKGTYLLPIKKEVRKIENLTNGSTVKLILKLLI
jgi:hypothetical protein